MLTSNEWKDWLEKIRSFGTSEQDNDTTDPRPFIQVNIYGQRFKALIDTGAVVSLINDEVATFLTSKGTSPRRGQYQISLANSAQVPVVWTYTFRSEINGIERELSMAHLPSLTVPIIFGVDIIRPLGLVKLNFPKWETDDQNTAVDCVNPGNEPFQSNEQEDNRKLDQNENEKLNTFLCEELLKFDSSTGRTTLVEHHIKLKNKEPIKQRYYPRNPAMQNVINEEVNHKKG